MLWMCDFLSSGGNRNLLLWLFFDKMFFVFPSVEACPVFYGGVASLLLGSKTLLNSTLDLVDSTDEEKAAFGKIQDCFNEEGFDAKLHISQLVVIYSPDLTLPCSLTSIVWYATWEQIMQSWDM